MKNRWIILLGVFIGSFAWASTEAPKVDPPSLTLLKRGDSRILRVTPPDGHTLNLGSPLKVELGSVRLGAPESRSKAAIDFLLKQPPEGETRVRAELFVCDLANTYCVRTVAELQVETLPVVEWLKIDSPASPKVASRSYEPYSEGKKGAWFVNLPEAAMQESKRTGKPMLIDFYGIWCPPCNVMDETVFSTKRFRALGSGFVLLKLDADHPVSWPLKERFVVAGYPTFVFAAMQSDGSLDEISRVVGSRKPKDFYSAMSDALAFKASSEKVLRARLAAIAMSKKDYALAVSLTTDTTVQGLEARIAQAKSLNDVAELERLRKKGSEGAPSWFSLSQSADLASQYEEKGQFDAKQASQMRVIELADSLLKTPSLLDGQEAQRQDVLYLKAEAEKALGKPSSKQTFGEMAREYRKLLGGLSPARRERERGWSLELAYAEREQGNYTEAEAIYSRLARHYPRESTFFFALSRLKLHQGELQEAKRLGEQALEFAYGDHRLNLVQHQSRVLERLGEKKAAIDLIDRELALQAEPADPNNRAHRIRKQLLESRAKLDSK